MIKILFVCHGNICRSAMAEFIMNDYIDRLNIKDIHVSSCAVSNEELGNDIYPYAKNCLDKHNIKYERHYAKRINQKDYDDADYIYVMDDSNLRNIYRIVDDKENKIFKLLDRNIADPWWTNDFETTYNDLIEGIENILTNLNYL